MRTLFLSALGLLLFASTALAEIVWGYNAPYESLPAPVLTIAPPPTDGKMPIEEARIVYDGEYVEIAYTFRGNEREVFLQISQPAYFQTGKHVYGAIFATLVLKLDGKPVALTLDSQAYSAKGENITALLAAAGLKPSRSYDGTRSIDAREEVRSTRVWQELLDKEALKTQDSEKYSGTPHWITKNSWWATVRMPKGSTTLSMRYRLPTLGASLRWTETLKESPKAEEAVRLVGMDVEQAWAALKPTKKDVYYGVDWFPIPLAPMPWDVIPKLHFEAHWPVYNEHVTTPVYLAARIGDKKVQGLGHISLTVENYSTIQPGLFCAVNFSDKF